MNNLISVRGGQVHAAHPYAEHEPLCSAGRKRNSRTNYQTTDAPVTCKNCGPDPVESASAGPRRAPISQCKVCLQFDVAPVHTTPLGHTCAGSIHSRTGRMTIAQPPLRYVEPDDDDRSTPNEDSSP